MRYGTSHFVSHRAARAYYRQQDRSFSMSDLEAKLEAGEISIGAPAVKPGTRLISDSEGRYFIEEKEPAERVRDAAPALQAALKAALPLLVESAEAAGPCDHAANICVCGIWRVIEQAGEALAEAEPCAS